MIKLETDITNNKIILEHDMCCKEQVIDEFVQALDIVIADYELKTTYLNKSLSNEEKEQLVISKRKEYLELMMKKECLCKKYLSDTTTHIKE